MLPITSLSDNSLSLRLIQYSLTGNHRLTNDGTDLALSLPKLEILITEVSVQKYFLFPKHCLVNWGHDIVIRWITGDMPAKSCELSSFTEVSVMV